MGVNLTIASKGPAPQRVRAPDSHRASSIFVRMSYRVLGDAGSDRIQGDRERQEPDCSVTSSGSGGESESGHIAYQCMSRLILSLRHLPRDNDLIHGLVM